MKPGVDDKKGATAPEAGMAIHNDFKDKFIRAEVIFGKIYLMSALMEKPAKKALCGRKERSMS